MDPPRITPKAKILLTEENSNWRTIEDVRRAVKGKPVKLSGNALDLNGCQISGQMLPKPSDDQDEGSAALRISIDGFRLSNGSVKGVPGGIIFKGDGLEFHNLSFLDIGEDALSNVCDRAPNADVINCQFFGASDKSGQFNDARGLTLVGNLFVGGITGCRLQKKATKYKGIKTRLVKGNKFIGCSTAWNISGGVQVCESGTVYENVNTKVVSNSGARMVSV